MSPDARAKLVEIRREIRELIRFLERVSARRA
jgi:hypothetical protein